MKNTDQYNAPSWVLGFLSEAIASVRQDALKSEKTPKYIIEHFAKKGNAEDLAAIASNPLVDEIVVEDLHDDVDLFDVLLEALLGKDNQIILVALAGNESLSNEQYQKLSQKASDEVLLALAKNTSLPQDVAMQIMHASPEIDTALAKHSPHRDVLLKLWLKYRTLSFAERLAEMQLETLKEHPYLLYTYQVSDLDYLNRAAKLYEKAQTQSGTKPS